MKLPLIDYRQFRLSRLNTPQFRHLKLLLFWPIFSLVFCYLENYRPTVYYAPMRLRAGCLRRGGYAAIFRLAGASDGHRG